MNRRAIIKPHGKYYLVVVRQYRRDKSGDTWHNWLPTHVWRWQRKKAEQIKQLWENEGVGYAIQ